MGYQARCTCGRELGGTDLFALGISGVPVPQIRFYLYTQFRLSTILVSSLVSGSHCTLTIDSNKPQNLTYDASPSQTTTSSSAMGHYFRWPHNSLVTRRLFDVVPSSVLHDLGGLTAPEDIISTKSGVLNPTGTHQWVVCRFTCTTSVN
jgi:hypothetical protein